MVKQGIYAAHCTVEAIIRMYLPIEVDGMQFLVDVRERIYSGEHARAIASIEFKQGRHEFTLGLRFAYSNPSGIQTIKDIIQEVAQQHQFTIIDRLN